MSVDKEFLVSEKALVRKRIKYAMDAFYAEPSKKSLNAVFLEFTYAYIYNLTFIVPGNVSKKGIVIVPVFVPNIGDVFQACTSPEDAAKCSGDSTFFVTIRGIFQYISDSPLQGMILDRFSEHKAYAFFNRENIRRIEEIALQSIDQRPEDVKQFLLKEI